MRAIGGPGHPGRLRGYSYDNFFDVMQSHPTLDGFWIDNDHQYWLDHNLYQQIYQLHSNMTLSNNNEDAPIMDMISNEQKTGMTPAYDMPQAYYTAAPRLIEADYKLPYSGSWWYDGSNSTVDYGLNIGRYIANAGDTVLSLVAETAQFNGEFPSNQATFNNFMQTRHRSGNPLAAPTLADACSAACRAAASATARTGTRRSARQTPTCSTSTSSRRPPRVPP
jgi:hypothetical protein